MKKNLLVNSIFLLTGFSIFTLVSAIGYILCQQSTDYYMPISIFNIFWVIWFITWCNLLILLFLVIKSLLTKYDSNAKGHTFFYLIFCIFYIIIYYPFSNFFINPAVVSHKYFIVFDFIGSLVALRLLYNISKITFKFNIKNLCILFIIIITTLFTFSFFYSKHNPKNKVDDIQNLASELNAELKNNNIDAEFDQKTPRNLVASFYLRTLYMWSGYYRSYYKVINCVTPKLIETNSIFNDDLNYRVKLLIVSLFDTNFKFDSIPEYVHSDKYSFTLGEGWNEQTFYIAKKSNGDWYFTEENFTNPKIIKKYDTFKKEKYINKNGQVKNLSIPVLAFTNFILGVKGKFGFNMSDATSVLEVDWIPKLVNYKYSRFLAFVLYKVLESEHVEISSLPGRTSPGNDVIVLYVSPQANRSIYLKKIYTKDGFKWCFTKDVLKNALEIYTKEKMDHSKSDPFWFKLNHVLWYKFAILQNNILRFIFIFITAFLTLIFAYKLSFNLLQLTFKDLKNKEQQHYLKLLKLFRAIAVTCSIYVTGLVIGNCIIFNLELFIQFTYIYKILFTTCLVWTLCELMMTISYYLISRMGHNIYKNFRANFLIDIISKIIIISIIIISSGLLLQNLGFNMINFLAALGVGGLAIAFAGKDTIENLFGSIMIAIERPFKHGDWIKIDKVQGTIEHLGLRSTRVRTFKDSYMTIPNVKFITSSVNNMGAREFRRYKTTLNLLRSLPPSLITEFISEIENIISTTPCIKNNDYHIKVIGIGDSSIQIMIYIYFDVNNWTEELQQREIFILKVLKIAKEIGVIFAYPSKSIYINNSTLTKK